MWSTFSYMNREYVIQDIEYEIYPTSRGEEEEEETKEEDIEEEEEDPEEKNHVEEEEEPEDVCTAVHEYIQ